MRSIIYHIAKLLFDALLFSSLSLFMCLYSNVILWEQRYILVWFHCKKLYPLLCWFSLSSCSMANTLYKKQGRTGLGNGTACVAVSVCACNCFKTLTSASYYNTTHYNPLPMWERRGSHGTRMIFTKYFELYCTRLPECLATIQNVLNIIIMQFNTKMLYYLSPSSSSASLPITSVVYSDSCLVNLALWRLFFFVIYIVDEIFYQSVCLTKVTINSDECKTNYYCSSKTL